MNDRIAELQSAYNAAREAVKSDRSPENMAAVVAESAELSAAIPAKSSPKFYPGYNSLASRSGRRQHGK